MDFEKFFKKYKTNFTEGFIQGIAYGVGLAFTSIIWHKYVRKIVFTYLNIPLTQSVALEGIKKVSFA
ncbi:hypothetical protein PPL_10065 [Heterostelium album PN500]|uniref:Uncharacterized protein n=1 Tax=Heterostelium pallidum (strain ATCC 26659 / Pp 5 / PN500) TaxID=670386 RepID=D3BQ82_HETP5|nr:hypothetical protein PPL_10065 [Heterostelium album PN500]EFA76302.1 hypothetical protein PPL_10065 [Heterostelium album PN500]|eukprot:XP_020428434.1 hypothetical protein PPL_10065 [Heterostelium album PN500]